MPVFRVQLPDYAGPLDLLLYLVRRSELDSASVRISSITSQFLEFLEVLKLLDFDTIGDFVVLASSLLELKSREVLPGADEAESPEPVSDDAPRGELIARLLEYKRYKEAAATLEVRATEWQRRYPRLSDDRPSISRDHAADPIREVELWDLVSALSRVLQKHAGDAVSSIKYDETPIATYSERISALVRERGRVPFSEFFEHTNQRGRIIGIFLAILELLRHHGFRAEQPDDYGEIYVLPPAEADAGAAA